MTDALTPRAEYWREAVMESIESVGVSIDLLTSEQWDEVGRSLAITSECQSLAFPSPDYRDPVADLKAEFKAFREHEHQWQCHSSSRYLSGGGGSDSYYCTYPRCNAQKIVNL